MRWNRTVVTPATTSTMVSAVRKSAAPCMGTCRSALLPVEHRASHRGARLEPLELLGQSTPRRDAPDDRSDAARVEPGEEPLLERLAGGARQQVRHAELR